MTQQVKIPILILTTTLERGGCEKMVYELATRLDRDRFDVTVASLLGPGYYGARLEAAGITVVACGMHGYTDLSVFLKLARLIVQKNIQIIHSFLFHANLIGRLLRLRFPQLTAISSIRTMEQGARWHLTVDRLTKSLVTAEVANCDAVRAFTIRHTGSSPKKIETIYNGVACLRQDESKPELRRQFGLPVDAHIIGTVGSLEEVKDHTLFIEMVYQLVHRQENIHAVIAGEGSVRLQLERIIQKRELTERITMLGFCDDSDRLMRTFDVFALTSRWEGFPNVVLEACAARVPVIATDVGGVREIVPRPDEQLCEVGDALALANCAGRFFGNTAWANAIADEGYARVSELFSYDVMVGKTQALYERCVKESDYI